MYGQPKGSDAATALDPAVLDQLITSLLGVQAAQQAAQQAAAGGAPLPATAQVAAGLSRFRPLSRSHRFGSTRSRAGSVRRGAPGAGAGAGGVGSAAPGANMVRTFTYA